MVFYPIFYNIRLIWIKFTYDMPKKLLNDCECRDNQRMEGRSFSYGQE